VPGLAELKDDRLWSARGQWHVESDDLAPYLVDGWSAPSTIEGRKCRALVGDDATLLVPNLMPDRQRVTLWVHGPEAGTDEDRGRLQSRAVGRAQFLWNGRPVGDMTLAPGWQIIELGVHDVALHTNELAIHARGACIGTIDVAMLRPR